MKARALLIIGVFALLLCPVVNADSPEARRPAERPSLHEYILEVNPTDGTVREVSMERDEGEAVVNPNFVLNSAVCTNCNGCPGPGLDRHIQVQLQAVNSMQTTGVGAGNVRTTRSSLFAVSPPEKNAIQAGQVVQLDFELQLLVCDGKTFKLYFDMCDPAPQDATQVCP